MDRLVRAFEALVKLFTSDLQYAKTTAYSVASFNPLTQTAALRSLDRDVSDLTEVPIAGQGLYYNLPPGTQVRVSYSGSQPYISGLASGGIQPIIPGSGSGVTSEIDAGYVLITQSPGFVIAATYFPAGLTGGLAAETARLAAVGAGLTAFLLHMNGGRVLPSAWTVP